MLTTGKAPAKFRGFALLTSLMLIVLISLAVGALSINVSNQTTISGHFSSSAKGSYAAEGGTNVRAAVIKDIFSRASLTDAVLNGSSPDSNSSIPLCTGNNRGSGDLGCVDYTIGNHTVSTSLHTPSANPMQWEIVPTGQRFEGLFNLVRRYVIRSLARNGLTGSTEGKSRMQVEVRSIPLFQFGIFFENDLDIYNGSSMALEGSIYGNKNIYLGPDAGGGGNNTGSLEIKGQLVASGRIYRGKIFSNSCSNSSGTVKVVDPSTALQPLPNCSNPRYELTKSDITPWAGKILFDQKRVQVPPTSTLDPVAGAPFWDRADLRLILDLTTNASGIEVPITSASSSLGIKVVDAAGNERVSATTFLNNCFGSIASIFVRNPNTPANSYPPGHIEFTSPSPRAVGSSNTFFDLREQNNINVPPQTSSTLLEIDTRALLDCIQDGVDPDGDGVPGPGSTFVLEQSRTLDDTTDNGLVVFASVKGTRSLSTRSFYGLRVRNGETIASNRVNAPDVRGLTFVSDQPIYVMGDYNSSTVAPGLWRPVAFIGDAFNYISKEWCDGSSGTNNPTTPTTWRRNECDRKGISPLSTKQLSNNSRHKLYAAILAGHDDYLIQARESGGVHNFIRYHESWQGAISEYKGSLVSLGIPRHADGPFRANPINDWIPYVEPMRDWSFETRFSNRALLPPATPEASFTVQRMFADTFE